MKNTKKLLILVLSLILVFSLTACFNDNDRNDETSVETNDETTEETTTETEQSDDDNDQTVAEGIYGKQFEIDITRAVQIFHDTFGDNTIGITKIEFDDHNNDYKYEIEGFKDGTEYEIKINASTGEVIKKETDDDEHNDDIFISLDDIISPEKAMEIAVEQSGVNHVEDWEIKTEDNRLVYEVELKNHDEAIIDALSGDFIEFD